MPGPGYRDEYEAALHKADALERENAELRQQLARRDRGDEGAADRALVRRPRGSSGSAARVAGAWAVVVGVFTVLYYALGAGR
jgi:hypothetical protein